MSGKHSPKVSSKSYIATMSKLQIETLKFVHNSCCFTIPELVISDQLNPVTDIFWTNFFRLTKFRTNLLPDHLSSEKSPNYRFCSGPEFDVSLYATVHNLGIGDRTTSCGSLRCCFSMIASWQYVSMWSSKPYRILWIQLLLYYNRKSLRYSIKPNSHR